MILYNHEYSIHTSKIEVKPVEVKETAKLYTVTDRCKCLGKYYKQIGKNDLEMLTFDYGQCFMVSEEPNAELFKHMIVTRQLERIELAKKRVDAEMERLQKYQEIKTE